MSLNDYRILNLENREVQDAHGGDEWVVIYEIPADKLAAERKNFRRSLDNVLPESSASDPFPPHIQYSAVTPVDSETYAVKCVYRRPTMSTILQPGRGWFFLDSYVTTKTRTVPVMSTDGEASDAAPPADPLQSFYSLVGFSSGATVPYDTLDNRTTSLYNDWLARGRQGKEPESVQIGTQQSPQVISRGTLMIYTCDWFTELWDLLDRGAEWIGKAGTTITIGAVEFHGPKLSAVRVGLRESDVSVVECTYKFSLRNTEWSVDGDTVTEKKTPWRLGGDSEVTRISTTSGGRAESMELIHNDGEAVTGYADFGDDWDDYFTWLPSNDMAKHRAMLGIERRVQTKPSNPDIGVTKPVALTDAIKDKYGFA